MIIKELIFKKFITLTPTLITNFINFIMITNLIKECFLLLIIIIPHFFILKSLIIFIFIKYHLSLIYLYFLLILQLHLVCLSKSFISLMLPVFYVVL